MLWFLMFGLIGLMAWALQETMKSFAAITSPWRLRLLARQTEVHRERARNHFLLVVTDPSLLSNKTCALVTQGLRLRKWKDNLLWSCLASFALWGACVAASFFQQVSALFPLGLGVLLVIIARGVPRLRPIAFLVFMFALFLWAGESSLRLAAGVGQSGDDVSLWLADGRAVPCLVWWLVGMIEGTIFGFEFLALAAALCLIAPGVMAINVGVALWLGERVGHSARLALIGKSRIAGVSRMARQQFLMILAGGVVGWLVIGFARDLWGPVSDIGGANATENLHIFLWLSLIAEIPVLAGAMAWGHFASAAPPSDLFDKTVAVPTLHEIGNSRPFVYGFLLRGLRARRDEILRLRTQFNENEWAKVPPAVRDASETERRELDRMLAEAESLRG